MLVKYFNLNVQERNHMLKRKMRTIEVKKSPSYRVPSDEDKKMCLSCEQCSLNFNRFIPASGSLILSANTSACSSTASEIKRLEHVQLNVTLQHRHRGDISITLISPSGTRSKLLTTRRNDHSARGLKVIRNSIILDLQ